MKDDSEIQRTKDVKWPMEIILFRQASWKVGDSPLLRACFGCHASDWPTNPNTLSQQRPHRCISHLGTGPLEKGLGVYFWCSFPSVRTIIWDCALLKPFQTSMLFPGMSKQKLFGPGSPIVLTAQP